MPYRNVRGVNRGVQDEEELKKIREAQKKKKREKAKKWCLMIGLTVVELILCLICFALGYYYYHTVEEYRNINQIRHHAGAARYILLPPTPLAVASVFLAITYVDLISWQSLRPITYFGWIMVATAGFLMFLLYAGVILLTSNQIAHIVAIVFGIITALVWLADLICMLLSMKRFPIPYWILKRKHDKMDQCVCTGDYDPEDEEVERPICRCGDHWGEPCTCDDPDLTCGCGAGKKSKEPPCECCECAAQALVEEDTDGTAVYGSVYDVRQSMVSTMSGRDVIEEQRRTTLTQASMPMDDYCTQRGLKTYCIDGPSSQMSPMSRITLAREPSSMDPYAAHVAPSGCSRRTAGAQSQAAISRGKSAYSQKLVAPSVISTSRLASPSVAATSSRLTSPSMATSSRLTSPSMAATSRLTSPSMATTSRLASPSVAVASRSGFISPSMTASVRAPSKIAMSSLASPSTVQAAKVGGPHIQLTDSLGAPSMTMASRLAMQKSQKSFIGRNKSELAYAVYETTVDDEEALRQSIALKYDCHKKESPQSNKPGSRKSIFCDESGQMVQMISRSSSDEEIGEGGDYPRKRMSSAEKESDQTHAARKSNGKKEKTRLRFSTFTATELPPRLESEIEYMSDSEITHGPKRLTTLPGQVSSLDDSETHRYYCTKKNVSVSARERCPRRTSGRAASEQRRPRSTMEGFSGPRIIRNVSTTVRAVRTLSRVMEADDESRQSISQSDVNNRESEVFPSECTITINKQKE